MTLYEARQNGRSAGIHTSRLRAFFGCNFTLCANNYDTPVVKGFCLGAWIQRDQRTYPGKANAQNAKF